MKIKSLISGLIFLIPVAVGMCGEPVLDLASETRVITNAAWIELFAHEEMVNSFLSVRGKFGVSRIIQIHHTNQRLTRHGGTTKTPSSWSSKSNSYNNTSWAMIGDVNTERPVVHFLDERKSADAFSQLPTVSFTYQPSGSNDFDLGALFKSATVAGEKSGAPVVRTRATDAFENLALASLKFGAPMLAWEQPDSLRLVGPIRAGAQCLKCHDGIKTGDMLGAFTYTYAKTRLATDPFATNAVVISAREGKTLTELAAILDSLHGEPSPNLGPRSRRGTIYGTGGAIKIILTAGVVLPEMVQGQAALRSQLMSRDLEKEMMEFKRSRDSVPTLAPPGI
ncbi:MAG: hypothetical protein HY301_02910 [Verrucomicrobia bacterium]|nr:hypothetical protein [Verrucomicrobiota bacterium]